MHPYCRILATRALTSCSFTLTLDIPSNLQFDLTAKNVLLDLFILAYSSLSGRLQLFDSIKPKYLNSLTVSTSFYPTFKTAFALIYIALVLDTFTSKSFSLQNYSRQSISNCNSTGVGASNTKSSAKVSKNI